MSDKQHTTIYLQDYTPPPYLVTTVQLRFELDASSTRVSSRMEVMRNPEFQGKCPPLELDGENLASLIVRLDGVALKPGRFTYDGKKLRIDTVPDRFVLEVENFINPAANTELEGLYLSSGNFCTQCEAEGFRRITCFPDRPDVMAVYTTTIVADRRKYPVLLANGNLREKGFLDDGRHFAVWHDPFPKPCYLFALVAGDLVRIEDRFRTRSGREVDLHIFVEPRNREQCDHAMAALKKAMRWDEETYGLEYDLDVYMIVAVDDFNMGAMENKGLNVFNSKYVLARPETATDADFEGIERVIAHEYFHNWTGNRVTCRDWFQLSLKEGLTVFRDQEFTSDITSRPVKRIEDVQIMRNYQFREDAGPLAHPVRPSAYMAINNFYTLTVYDKGAEVIRMLHTLLGREGFRKGLDLYFQRHDGQAVTCDDFVAAMLAANDTDLPGFKLWYSQAGTPVLRVAEHYDESRREYRLTLHQSCPPTPGQERKEPLPIPVAVGLLASDGRDMDLGGAAEPETTRILHLRETEETFVFPAIREKPVLSLLRNFSAPVKVEHVRPDQELAFIMAHDADPFNRWDAGQQLALKCILAGLEGRGQGKETEVPELFVDSFQQVLLDQEADPAFVALALALPQENWIGQQLPVIDPLAIFSVLQAFRRGLRRSLRAQLEKVYERNQPSGPYRYTSAEAGRRSLKNTCLAYLLAPDEGGGIDSDLLALARRQYANADNMTDRFSALRAIVNADRAAGDRLLESFYQQWRQDPLVVDKWLSLQALCTLPGTLERVKALTAHPAFVLKNPNKVRALIGAFCAGNQAGFHESGGAGYAFLADYVLRLDAMNPQIAARQLTPLTTWQRYDPERQTLMRGQLERIMASSSLSGELAEVVGKSLRRAKQEESALEGTQGVQ
ncbi:MAG: aminopeptidase N [Desulfobulbus sp.]|nr:MAG: aminopeptidase N [Desulfobulbus sp.]